MEFFRKSGTLIYVYKLEYCLKYAHKLSLLQWVARSNLFKTFGGRRGARKYLEFAHTLFAPKRLLQN